MAKKKNFIISFLIDLLDIFSSKTYMVIYIPISIYFFKSIDVLYPVLQKYVEVQWHFLLPNIKIYSTDTTFFGSFIEWFGVLYGFLLPLILVRVWEQFDSIDREFDREADAVNILNENLNLMHKTNEPLRIETSQLLQDYADHVIKYHNEEINDKEIRKMGNAILKQVREKFKHLLHTEDKNSREPDALISELIKNLDDIIDIRGDRIALSNQRLFEVLRTIALITSIIFLLPFYYVSFTAESGVLNNMLVFGVTLLVILIYIIIDDLDEPFTGIWHIGTESWVRVKNSLTNNAQE